MNTNNTSLHPELETELQKIVKCEDLDSQRVYLEALTARLGISLLDCAAALIVLLRRDGDSPGSVLEGSKLCAAPFLQKFMPQTIKMARYRLDVGRQHQVTTEVLKKVLIEESGVDKNNIMNIEIQESHTWIELPDDMPQDIFQHLKSVEINNQKLDIKRVKNRRAKKRPKHRYGRNRHHSANKDQEAASLANKI